MLGHNCLRESGRSGQPLAQIRLCDVLLYLSITKRWHRVFRVGAHNSGSFVGKNSRFGKHRGSRQCLLHVPSYKRRMSFDIVTDRLRTLAHLLRHACGTHMHDHGAPLQAVATFLGHARLSTAQIYARVSVGRMMETYRKAHPHAKKVAAVNAPEDTNWIDLVRR